MQVRDKHDAANSMGAHQYENIDLVKIDEVLRAKKNRHDNDG